MIDRAVFLCYNIDMIKKRAIAFDIGNKRIGVAISDPFNEYAMPCETYVRVGNFQKDVAMIAKIAEDRGVGVIVCGLPYNFDGTESIQTVKTRQFIEALKEKTSLPIELEDERFTTMQARETQIMGGVKREDRKKTIDSIAASYILESFLSREKNKNKKSEEISMLDNENELNEEYEDEENRIFELEAEDGTVEKLYHIATIEYRGGMYCCFQKAEPETEEEEDEIAIFNLQGEGDDALLVPLEDEQLLDEVFAEFCHQYEDYEDDGDAAAIDGKEN
ncbi:MAG: Holliday junction resolvase RuvX [Clostridia bacterium]|nr:Holliday junction resolvase RuvX [Clostridia bacterium]